MENREEHTEKIFYNDEDVTITQSRYVTNTKTYAMRNISSVAIFEVSQNYSLQIILLLLGLVMLVVEDVRIIATIIIAISIYWIIKTKGKYAVRISTNAGETNSIVHTDKIYVKKVVNALNEAMIYRG